MIDDNARCPASNNGFCRGRRRDSPFSSSFSPFDIGDAVDVCVCSRKWESKHVQSLTDVQRSGDRLLKLISLSHSILSSSALRLSWTSSLPQVWKEENVIKSLNKWPMVIILKTVFRQDDQCTEKRVSHYFDEERNCSHYIELTDCSGNLLAIRRRIVRWSMIESEKGQHSIDFTTRSNPIGSMWRRRKRGQRGKRRNVKRWIFIIVVVVVIGISLWRNTRHQSSSILNYRQTFDYLFSLVHWNHFIRTFSDKEGERWRWRSASLRQCTKMMKGDENYASKDSSTFQAKNHVSFWLAFNGFIMSACWRLDDYLSLNLKSNRSTGRFLSLVLALSYVTLKTKAKNLGYCLFPSVCLSTIRCQQTFFHWLFTPPSSDIDSSSMLFTSSAIRSSSRGIELNW